ncbi:hypothetical protein OY671_010475, partial [Metschnikowia pulcherrima]
VSLTPGRDQHRRNSAQGSIRRPFQPPRAGAARETQPQPQPQHVYAKIVGSADDEPNRREQQQFTLDKPERVHMEPLTMHPNRTDASDLAEMSDFSEVAMRAFIDAIDHRYAHFP